MTRAGSVFTAHSPADYATLGIARISLGLALARAMLDTGDFKPPAHSLDGAPIDGLLQSQS